MKKLKTIGDLSHNGAISEDSFDWSIDYEYLRENAEELIREVEAIGVELHHRKYKLRESTVFCLNCQEYISNEPPDFRYEHHPEHLFINQESIYDIIHFIKYFFCLGE